MAYVKDAHQYAGDARSPFAFGGSGAGHVIIESDWKAAELTLDASQKIWKAQRNCVISSVTIRVTDMDTHGTPTLEWNIGTTIDGAEVYTGNTATIGETGGATFDTVYDGGVIGFNLAAGAFLYLNVEEAAATGADGTVTVQFDVHYL
jgi:hypothetical protein